MSRRARAGLRALAAIALFASAAPSPFAQAASPSILDQERQTLLYGIDSQVLDLLKTIAEEQTSALDPQIVEVFEQSTNPDVQVAALGDLSAEKDWSAAGPARSALQSYAAGSSVNEDLVIAAIRYLRDSGDAQSVALFSQLLGDPDASIASAAIDAVGKRGGSPEAAKVLADLDSSDYPSGLKPLLILALGDLKASGAVADLTKILKNVDEDPVMRRYACDALGKIADPASLAAIIGAFSDKDSYLRAYAVSALSRYSGPKVDAMLAQGLKDSFWRVRVGAAQALGDKKSVGAVPILEYKARYDPEPNVQGAAIAALGKIDSGGAPDFLKGLYGNDLLGPARRTEALDALVANDLSGSLPAITKVIDAQWAKDPQSSLLDYTAKQLSQARDPALHDLYGRLLKAPTVNLRIYGIRGAALNGMTDFRPEIEAMSRDKTAAEPVRAAAEAALQVLK